MRRIFLLIIIYLFSIAFFAPHVSAQTTFHLRIEGSAQTYFDDQVSVDACAITDSTGNEHTYTNSAACGIVEAARIKNFTYTFQDFGFGLMLTRIGTDTNAADFSKSWIFWLNDAPASTGLDSYTPNTNDEILLAYTNYPGIPLKIDLPADAQVGQPITLNVKKRTGTTDTDWNWHGTWEPANGATLHLNGLSLLVPETGRLTLILTDVMNNLWANGDNFIRSSHLTISDNSPTPTPTPSPTPTPTPQATPTPNTTPAIDRIAAAKRALAYLRDRQDSDGTIGGSSVSAWSTIAFGANEDKSETIKKGNVSLLSAFTKTQPESATDIERLILALRATGQSPRNYQGTDYVKQLKNKYYDNQFGETTLINDDIFGILALLAADEPRNSIYLHDSVTTLLKKQNNVGAWENLDLTAATIQALKRYQQLGGDINIKNNIEHAKDYLKNHQDNIGGFGENSATTAWGIQAIVALGEDPLDWNITSNNPITALISYQNSDGGFGWKNNIDVSTFMTAYAIPALLYTPLPVTKLQIETVNQIVVLPSPTPAATPTTSPKITHSTSNNNSSTPTKQPLQPTHGNNSALIGTVAGVEVIPSPAPNITIAMAPTTPPTKPSENNTVFMLSLGFTNIGIGVATTRLISKLHVLI